MADASLIGPSDTVSKTAAAAVAVSEIQQLADGRASVYTRAVAATSGTRTTWRETGKYTVTKTAGIVLLDGQEVYWDHSANAATYKPNGDRDFYLGTCIDDAASADTTCAVNLNVRPTYLIDLQHGAWLTTIVQTGGTNTGTLTDNSGGSADTTIEACGAAVTGVDGTGSNAASKADVDTRLTAIANNFADLAAQLAIQKTLNSVLMAGKPAVSMRGGSAFLLHTAIAEAQKADLLSRDGWAIGANAIVEGQFTVLDDGDANAIDFNIGISNGTHATDADSITEACFLHLDGDSLDLYAASRDGTTTVAATDTTVNITLGTPVYFAIDTRNPADIQIYVNGVLVLGSTVFKLDAASGPLRLLAHLEKTSDDTTAEYHIDRLSCRIAEQ